MCAWVSTKTHFYEEDHEVEIIHQTTAETRKIKATFKNGQWHYEMEPNVWINKTVLSEQWKIKSSKFVYSPIAEIPSHGYVANDQFSLVSIQWLEWMHHRTGREIEHALNGYGEHKVPGTKWKVDGFDRATRTALEFHGCLFHGCRRCHKLSRDTVKHPYTQQSMDELYVLTKKKEAALRAMGYNYECKWECEFRDDMVKNRDGVKDFVNQLDLVSRLNPRDSFFGGRTNATKLHHKVQEDEKIRYVDFTSLYPYINKYSKYPVGHPKIITKEFQGIEQYFGLAKVKILPPRGLYHPVLPYRSGGKLKFPLCQTCADNETQTPCECTEDARALTGTWCTPEIHMAMSKGYRIVKIYEVYHWEKTMQYQPGGAEEEGLFTAYINTFLKIKQEASGWPAWCTSEQEKQEYITKYHEKEGILLDHGNIEYNAGLRQVAKLCLNSFWGKFAQRLNLTQSTYIHSSEPEKFSDLILDATKQIEDFVIINPDLVHIQWSYVNEFQPRESKTNIFVATFTTCWARLKLYELLDILDRRVLYFDTDSVIYSTKPGQDDVPTGDFLGDLTDELPEGQHIVEYVSGGPKNYAYRTSEGVEVCKVRGFTLNFANSRLINFDAVKDIVVQCHENPELNVTIQNNAIVRDKFKRKLFNRSEEKSYRMVYTKRIVQVDLDTLPYGY